LLEAGNDDAGHVCTGVTMLLTLSVLQLVVNDTLPTTSDAVPLLGKSDSLYRTLLLVKDHTYLCTLFLGGKHRLYLHGKC